MPKRPAEPTNLVLEQLRAMRVESAARFDKIDSEIADLKRDVRGLKLNGIAEIYKANLTVASFVDLERRVQALEERSGAGGS